MNETVAAVIGSVRRPSSAFTTACTDEATPAARMKKPSAISCMRVLPFWLDT